VHLSFAGDRKLSGAVDIHEGREAMQRGFERLEEWANENLMEVNKVKFKVLQLSRSNAQYQYRLGYG